MHTQAKRRQPSGGETRPGHTDDVDTSPSPVAAARRTRRQWTPQSHAEHYIGHNLDEGRFVIRSLIAQGGMADVFLADDRRDGRPVAIKILRADDVDSEEGRRFAWEVRMLANLQHPNLIAVLATGTTDEGNPYMVQPYLGGDTLRARLAGGPLGWRVALEVGVQIADVLQCLHEAGVVHRDVKIDNIIWARHPTQPVWVKLIDLGIAKLLGWVPPPIEAALPLDQRATKIGHVLGTDGYRPPEALEGICTPRFDIFSLGVTLYRLCANAMPEPEVRPLAEVCPGWDGPAEFEAAIRKAMDPDPERRFASAESLRLTLEAIRTCNPDPDRPRHLFAGRFDLLRPLGSGAKATTYAAYDRELEATAAIKLLSAASQADPDECLRFIREAMILRHVRHPNLPAFFELGTHAGQRYLAMELCPGKRAREYTLPTTCLRPAEVVRIGEQLASALKALGEAGVIYRDLTHDNVLIHFSDRDPKVKLIDFNASLLIEDRFYARLDERWARPPEQRLRPNRELGLQTMSYAAPEVRAGAPWSEASDVFALGRLLYLLLTGQEPFPCAVPKGTMAPPWREDCPENLLMALESALAIDPAERGTVDDIIDFLSGAREEIEQDEKAARTRSARNVEPDPMERASASPALAPAAAVKPEPLGDAGSKLEDVTTLEPSVSAAERNPAVVSPPAARRSRQALGALGVLAAGVVLVVRSLLPGEPAADNQAAAFTKSEPVAAEPAAEPPRFALPPGEPADPPPAALVAVNPVLDMEDTLTHVDEELRACARTAGRRITVDLAVSANGTRFDSVVIMPADANVDRCVRELLEPLRFRAHSSATTFIKRYQP